MYVVHAFATSNSVKVPIPPEEPGLAYELRPVHVRQGAQKTPEHLARNPNGETPVLEGAETPPQTPSSVSDVMTPKAP